eukprot:GHVN01094871.1.p1 GENE.GHVN01094871.1~~GHVN01094871.1.p1  ORF type:complete len:139 (-),score=9.21 GHVN01094871.1:110-526(-)
MSCASAGRCLSPLSPLAPLSLLCPSDIVNVTGVCLVSAGKLYSVTKQSLNFSFCVFSFKVGKAFHGSDNDVLWLYGNFSIVVYSLFDTMVADKMINTSVVSARVNCISEGGARPVLEGVFHLFHLHLRGFGEIPQRVW